MYASFEASFFTKRVEEDTMRTAPNPIHNNRPSSIRLWINPLTNATCKGGFVAVAMRADAEMQRHLEINGLQR